MNKRLNVDVQNINRHGYNLSYCFDDCIATIAGYEGFEYRLMYLRTGVAYNSAAAETDGKVLSGIEFYSDFIGNLEKYCSIKMNMILNDSSTFYYDVYREIENNKLVILQVDGFYLPWDVDFEKKHNSHMLLANGVSDGLIIVTDPFYNRDGKILISKLSTTSSYAYTYQILSKSRKQISYGIYSKEISDSFSALFGNLEDFKSHIDTIYDGNLEFEIDDKFDYVQRLLLSIVSFRGRFYNTLDMFYEYAGFKNEDVEITMQQIIEQWLIFKNIINKEMLTGRNCAKSALSEKLNKIILYEKCLFHNFKEDMEKTDRTTSSFVVWHSKDSISSRFFENMSCIDLQQYYNNRAFGSLCIDNTADLTGGGEFLAYNKQSLDSMGNVKFITNVKRGLEDGKFDNISCCGQSIEVQCNKQTSNCLFLLATSEFGESFDSIRILSYDAAAIEIYYKLSDISMAPLHDEKIIWTGNTFYKTKDRTGENVLKRHLERAYIFLLSFRWDNECEITNIVLPDCPNTHIFAITVGKIKYK